MKNILDTLSQDIYIKRIQTFTWNLFYMILIFGLGLATDLIPTLGLNESVAVILSMVVAQLSKLVYEKTK